MSLETDLQVSFLRNVKIHGHPLTVQFIHNKKNFTFNTDFVNCQKASHFQALFTTQPCCPGLLLLPVMTDPDDDYASWKPNILRRLKERVIVLEPTT